MKNISAGFWDAQRCYLETIYLQTKPKCISLECPKYSLEVLNILKYPFKLYNIFRVYHKEIHKENDNDTQSLFRR